MTNTMKHVYTLLLNQEKEQIGLNIRLLNLYYFHWKNFLTFLKGDKHANYHCYFMQKQKDKILLRFWPRPLLSVSRYVRSCPSCQRNNSVIRVTRSDSNLQSLHQKATSLTARPRNPFVVGPLSTSPFIPFTIYILYIYIYEQQLYRS